MPAKYVALFRGINVTGNNILPMKDLAKSFEKAGCGSVQTYIQSGNVIFECTNNVARVQQAVVAAIEKKFGFNPPLVLRQAAEFENVIRNNPFLKPGANEKELHVVFLSGELAADSIEKLERYRVAPDEFAVRGKEIYLRLPNGMGRSKLGSAVVTIKLGVIATARNWRTVSTLYKMMK